MLRERIQKSIFDTDFLCEELIPQDSFFRKFRELVWPVIKDVDFESLYCKDNGRPAISPSLLAMATIIQMHKNLSDREMERSALFDLEIKYALGVGIDERPFDHSSLGDFRKRLLENGKEKLIFDKILKKLVKDGLIESDEIQRIDATHVIANVAIPSMVTLIKKGIYEVLKVLEKENQKIYKKVLKSIHAKEYTKEEVNHDAPGRLDIEKRERKLVLVVEDAKIVLRLLKVESNSELLNEKLDILKRIIRENIEEDKNGDSKEIKKSEKPSDLLVSPIDPDARYGCKAKGGDLKFKFHGFKANITETVRSRFITSIKGFSGNRHDSTTMVEQIKEQKKFGLVPEKLIGDAAYTFAEHRKQLDEHGTQLVSPLYTKNNRTKEVFPKSMFLYDREKDTLTCPMNVTTDAYTFSGEKKIKNFRFLMSKCKECVYKSLCTQADEGRRVVGIAPEHELLMETEIYNQTENFKQDMKLRPPVEGKISEIARQHRLRWARYRGLKKFNLQCYFTAAIVNIKRWIKLTMGETMLPKGRNAVLMA